MSNITPAELSPAAILRGKLLSPETVTLLTYESEVLADRMLHIIFSADPTEREIAILTYVEAQAKRNTLVALVQESADTFAELAALEQQDRS